MGLALEDGRVGEDFEIVECCDCGLGDPDLGVLEREAIERVAEAVGDLFGELAPFGRTMMNKSVES